MFGVSLWELGIVAVVALVIVGPQKLPGMLRTLGEWIYRARQLTTDVRKQTGIDEILREEGVEGGITGLRSMLRGDLAAIERFAHRDRMGERDQYSMPSAPEPVAVDRDREYPVEGADLGDVIPDDLVDDEPAPFAAPTASTSDAAELPGDQP